MSYRYIKKQSHQALKNNWFCAAKIILTFILIFILPYAFEVLLLLLLGRFGIINLSGAAFTSPNPIMLAVTLIRIIVTIIIATPLYFGILLWYWELAKGNRHEFYECFGFFTNRKLFFRVIWLKLSVGIRVVASYLIALIPISISMFLFEMIRAHTSKSDIFLLLLICSTVLSIVTIISISIFCMRYLLVDFIYIANPDMPIREIIRQSKSTMSGRKANSLCFILSFSFWFLMCIFILPIIYVLPYFTTSLSSYTRKLYTEE